MYGKGCGEIVLLGDIFDLWKARPDRALRDSRYLFERLSDLDVKMSYVVGNHDHPLSFGKAHSLDVFSYMPFDGFHVIILDHPN